MNGLTVKAALLTLALAAAAGAEGFLLKNGNPVRKEFAAIHRPAGVSERYFHSVEDVIGDCELVAALNSPDREEKSAAEEIYAAGTPEEQALARVISDRYGSFGAEDFAGLARSAEEKDFAAAGELGEREKKDALARALYDAYAELHGLYFRKNAAVAALREIYRELRLDETDRADYINGQLDLFKIEAGPVPGEPESMMLKFTSGFGDYYVHEVRFDMELSAGSGSTPLYRRKDVLYPFLSPVAPGEVREEIVSCGAECQKALAAKNVAGKFSVAKMTGHVPYSAELVQLVRPEKLKTEKTGQDPDRRKEIEKRAGELREADRLIAEARARIDRLLSDDLKEEYPPIFL